MLASLVLSHRRRDLDVAGGRVSREASPADGFPECQRYAQPGLKRVEGRNLQLDIYSPKSIIHALPVVLWIHGHRWSKGSKKQRPPVNFVAQRYIVVRLDYRLSAEPPFSAVIEDSKAAVHWLRANATTYHIDSRSHRRRGSFCRGTPGCAPRYLRRSGFA